MAITADRLPPLARRLIPSFADLLFVLLVAVHTGPALISDGDTGWHLIAGYQTLAHGPGAVPDPLSWSRAGAPWRSPQWLAEAAFAQAHRHGGWVAVAFLVTITFAATFAWLYRVLLRECGHAPAALGVAALASAATWPHLLARPEIFAFPLFVAALVAVRGPGPVPLLLLPALAALWANVHPSAILAPAVAAMAWWLAPRDRRLLAAAILAALALGVTPTGFGWLGDLVPSREGMRYLRMIDEWSTPGFREPRYWALFLALLLALAARMRGAAMAVREGLLGLLWLALTLTTARAGAFAVLFWSFRLARDLAQPGDPRRAGFWRGFRETCQPFEDVLRPGLWPALIALALLAGAPLLAPRMPRLARGFTDPDLPLEAIAHARSLGLGARVLNDYGWGGYLSWESQARWKVFIDGRAGFFGSAVLADYLNVMRLEPGWLETLERRNPDWILVRTRTALVSAAPLTHRWRIVHSDTLATILVPAR